MSTNGVTFRMDVIKMMTSTRLTFIFVTFLSLPSLSSSFPQSDSASRALCPSGWQFLEASKKCVFVDRNLRGSFGDAEKLCQKLNSSMMLLNSAEEASEADAIIRHSSGFRFWLGYTLSVDKSNSREWKPSKPENYSNWSYTEPNCLPSSHCCVLVNSRSSWVDVDCNTNKALMVCQKSPFAQEPPGPTQLSEASSREVLFCFLETVSFNSTQIVTTLRNIKKRIESESPPTEMLERMQKCQRDQLEIIRILGLLIGHYRNCSHRNSQKRSERLGISFSQQFDASKGHEPLAYSIVAAIVLAILFLVVAVLYMTSRIFSRWSSDGAKQNQLLLSSSQWPSRCSEAAFD